MGEQTAIEASQAKERQILRAMKLVLTGVIKDTATPPGMRHPLSERTIEDIRQCLTLIAAREHELAAAAGEVERMRPRFVDEPSTTATIPVSGITTRRKTPPAED